MDVALLVGAVVFGLAVLGLIAAQWLFLWSLLGQNGRILMRLEALERQLGADTSLTPPPDDEPSEPPLGLAVGEAAPDFTLRGLRGEALTLASLYAAEKPVMLLFTEPDSGPCTAMLPEVRRWQKAYDKYLTITLVSRGTVEENRAKSTEHGLRGVLLQDDREVSEAYGIESTPSAVLVRPDGTIDSPVLEGADSISGFLEHVVGEGDWPLREPEGRRETLPSPTASEDGATRTASEGLGVGDPAPRFELPDLNEANVALRYFEGEKVLVLFWDPQCGFCREMLPDLRGWEDNRSREAPNLFVVSTGTREASGEMGLSSPVVLDEQRAVGPVYGAPGTPSAVVVDEHGKIASELAVGAPAVLSLLSRSLQEHKQTHEPIEPKS